MKNPPAPGGRSLLAGDSTRVAAGVPARRVSRPLLRFAPLLALLLATPAAAQLIPWSEPPTVAAATPAPPVAVPVKKLPPRVAAAVPLEIPVALPASENDGLIWSLFTPPANLILTSFAPTDPGAVRTGTSWVGQVTQHAHTLTVARTAADDNGWGATGLALNAAPYTYFNLTAQRDAHALPPIRGPQLAHENPLRQHRPLRRQHAHHRANPAHRVDDRFRRE